MSKVKVKVSLDEFPLTTEQYKELSFHLRSSLKEGIIQALDQMEDELPAELDLKLDWEFAFPYKVTLH